METKIATRLDDLPTGARVYVAGPMSGYENYNFDAFYGAKILLEALGFVVVNPADVDKAIWGFDAKRGDRIPLIMTRKRVLAIDIGVLLPTCDAIYLLPGWSESCGAVAEFAAAQTYNDMSIVFSANAERGFVGAVLEEGSAA